MVIDNKSITKGNKYQPADDYYNYVNSHWIDEQTKALLKDPKYYVEVDDFRIVQDNVYHEIMDLVKEYIKNNKGPKSKNVSNLLNSVKSTTTKQLHDECKTISKTIDQLSQEPDFYKLLAYVNRNEIVSWSSPISWFMMPDEKNVKKYKSHLSSGMLTLYDYVLYIDDPSDDNKTKQMKKDYKTKYLKMVKDVFHVCDPKSNINPHDIWDIEYDILMELGCNEKLKEDADYYNVVSKRELKEIHDFDLELFLTTLGYKSHEVPKSVILSTNNSFKCMVRYLKENWNNDKMNTYWKYLFYKQMCRFTLHTREAHFKFFGNYVEGSPVEMPKEIYGIFMLAYCFNTLISNLYIEKNSTDLNNNYIENIFKDLRYLFRRKIKENTWLAPSTKRSALKKLEEIQVVVCKPNLQKDPILDYSSTNIFDNLRKIVNWKLKQNIKKEGSTIESIQREDQTDIDWSAFKMIGTQPYMVNAYYRPTSNSIFVPCAYLQKPFLDLNERGLEYNLAYMGYTLGHELGHCIDDMGSKYDEKGNLNNWWTPHDKKIFQGKIRDVVKQYEFVAKRDGIDFDAKIGVGEDIADIVGLDLAQEYLLYAQYLNEDIALIKKLSLEAFYVYTAIQSRQKIFNKALPAQLKTNPHPLEKYRCNCPLSRLDLFRKIYNVKKGDKMWWHSKDTIW